MMSWIELAATVCGFLCVVLTIYRSVWCWPVGLVQVLLFIAVFYDAKLYSDLLLHVIYVFLCGTDMPYEDSWDRSGEVHRTAFQARIEADLHERGIAFHLLQGDLESRADQVIAKLKAMDG